MNSAFQYLRRFCGTGCAPVACAERGFGVFDARVHGREFVAMCRRYDDNLHALLLQRSVQHLVNGT